MGEQLRWTRGPTDAGRNWRLAHCRTDIASHTPRPAGAPQADVDPFGSTFVSLAADKKTKTKNTATRGRRRTDTKPLSTGTAALLRR